MDKTYYQDLNFEVLEFLENLKKEENYSFYPALKGLTNVGKSLNLGFSCYGLKIYYMTGAWDKLSEESKKDWLTYLNSFQISSNRFPENSFVDEYLVNDYDSLFTKNYYKYITKTLLNTFLNKNYSSKEEDLLKAINAETKQAVATLYEVNEINEKKVENIFKNKLDLANYLSSLNWLTPWGSGAQFSSICVFNATQNLNLTNDLSSFIETKLNPETGSYHDPELSDKREIINGAMKVISGLDWLDARIHSPKKLIDFCLDNKPFLEGCDIVDYVYVLYKCSKQDDHRKSEIEKLFIDLLNEIMILYKPKNKGFSYFKDRSQTHYYGAPITKGENTADIHGTTLCIWAVNMILDTLGHLDNDFNIIKP